MLCTLRTTARINAVRGFYSRFYDVVDGQASSKQSQSINARRTRDQPAQCRSLHTSSTRHQVRRSIPDDEPKLSTNLRDVMRKMPHSVVTITTSVGGSSATSSFRGMTVSSFTTLTLTPTPIITFNIRKPSRTLDAIRESQQFLVHILSATVEGAQTAHHFTRGNSEDVFKGLDKGKGFAVWNCGSECPLPLLCSPGVTKVLRCKLREDDGDTLGGLVEVGDHVLVLADVESIIEPPTRNYKASLEDRGLSYLDRAYRAVGDVIEVLDAKEDEAIEENDCQ